MKLFARQSAQLASSRLPQLSLTLALTLAHGDLVKVTMAVVVSGYTHRVWLATGVRSSTFSLSLCSRVNFYLSCYLTSRRTNCLMFKSNAGSVPSDDTEQPHEASCVTSSSMSTLNSPTSRHTPAPPLHPIENVYWTRYCETIIICGDGKEIKLQIKWLESLYTKEELEVKS